jgi:glycosyltransferase involved in cell wall biosynthesis
VSSVQPRPQTGARSSSPPVVGAPPAVPATVAIVHDYLTQRGGAERVVLAMAKAFPEAGLYTSLFDPDGTFSAFGNRHVHTTGLDRVPVLRRHHRLALPFLAPAFDRLAVEAEVVFCSSSGWAHGARVNGRKVVYCHTPARWLYQRDRYLRESSAATKLALGALRPYLVRWDRRAAASADRYIANSTAVRARIQDAYGRDAEVLSPPHAVDTSAPQEPIEEIEPGFLLCVSRLLPYKNVDAVVGALDRLPDERLVVVGTGPDGSRLHKLASRNVTFLSRVSDEQLRWLYASCRGLVSASFEDFGLTPLEAAAFGKPVAVLRWGGFLDTVVEGRTGLFFDRPEAPAVVDSLRQLLGTRWDEAEVREHAGRFAEPRFIARLHEIAADELA